MCITRGNGPEMAVLSGRGSNLHGSQSGTWGSTRAAFWKGARPISSFRFWTFQSTWGSERDCSE